MDLNSDTASVSKGCFAFVPASSKRKRKSDDFLIIHSQPWYKCYKQLWNHLKIQIDELNENISSNSISDIVQRVSKFQYEQDNIHTIALFTGINLPDHDTMFSRLSSDLNAKLYCRICFLASNTATTIGSAIENMVYTFIINDRSESDSIEFSSDEENSLGDEMPCLNSGKLRRSDCNMITLSNWYKNIVSRDKRSKFVGVKMKDGNMNTSMKGKPPLVVILKDIEAHNNNVLEEFLLILSVYSDRIPWVVILGVATSLSTIHNMLPHRTFSKLTVHLFRSQPSVVYLNNMLEKILLTSNCPFQLGSKVFNYLTDLFLFYNFSVTGFIRGIQFSLMDHLYYSNLSSLCANSVDVVQSLSVNQLKEITQLPSMISYIECKQKTGDIFPVSGNLKVDTEKLLNEFHAHTARFHIAIRCLNSLVKTLPQAPLGKHIREIYAEAMSKNITDSTKFRTCFSLLAYISKEELLQKLLSVTEVLLSTNSADRLILKNLKVLNEFKDRVSCADMTKMVRTSGKSPQKLDLNVASRSQLRQKLLDNVHREKLSTEYERVRKEVFDYLTSDEFFKSYLKPACNLPLHELFVYDDISMVRAHIDCVPRASLHVALKNPHNYLMCNCCSSVDNNEILRSMPDICIAYKLHLECGTLINLYDWLQSFVAVTNADADYNNIEDEVDQVNPNLHARFSQAVAELQFMGFVRPTKRKLDHVERLTFDGN